MTTTDTAPRITRAESLFGEVADHLEGLLETAARLLADVENLDRAAARWGGQYCRLDEYLDVAPGLLRRLKDRHELMGEILAEAAALVEPLEDIAGDSD